MEALSGTLLNVILKIKEGNGFGFLSSPLVIVANLNGNALETEPITCKPSPAFGSDFVWEAEKKILRRMRSGNTSLRIECMTQQSGKRKEKIGYILLNLKQAQIISSSCQTIPENWYRLLGVRPEMKPHNPEILLSLLIKEADFALEQPPKSNAVSSTNSKALDECSYIQIGPAAEATQLYSFSVDITAAVNLNNLIGEGRGDAMTLSCLLFGSYFSTKDLSRVNGDLFGERLHLTVRSSPNLLSQYFTEFPQVEFTLLFGLISIAKATLVLQSFVNGCESLGIQGSVTKEGRVWFSDVKKAYVDVTVLLSCEGRLPGSEPQLSHRSTRSNRSSPRDKKKIPDTSQKKPLRGGGSSSKLAVKKKSKEDCLAKLPEDPAPELEITHLPSPKVVSKPSSPKIDVQSIPSPKPVITAVIPPEPVTQPSDPQVPQSAVPQQLLTPTHVVNVQPPLSPQTAPVSEVAATPVPPVMQVPASSMATYLPQQPIIYQPIMQPMVSTLPEGLFKPTTIQPPPFAIPTVPNPFENPFASILQDNGDPIAFPPPIPPSLIARQEEEKASELTKNIVEELEDWKEKQQMMYKIELKAKCEREVKRLTAEWSRRQAELESEMARRVEESANLTEQLHASASELALRNAKVAELQRELEQDKERVDNDYASKLQDLREASKKHQHHIAKQLKDLQAEKDGLKMKLYTTEQELERYRAGLNPASENRLTDNQMTSLLVDMKCLEEKLAAAIESKEFFRKEWGRALREIHRMKTEQEAVIRQQLEANRNELNSLRLVGLIEDEKSAKEDMASIQDLKLELTRLLPRQSQEMLQLT